MTGTPIDDALAGIPDYGLERLGHLKNVRARMQVGGWLETEDIPPLPSGAEGLSEVRKFVLIAPSELIRLISLEDELMGLSLNSKIARWYQELAEEIDGLRRGEESKVLTPLPIRQSKHNSKHARQFRQVLGSALVILSGPKRGDGKGGNLRSGQSKCIMTREAAHNFILDTLIEKGVEQDSEWLRREFKRYHSRPENYQTAYIDPPSRLSIMHPKKVLHKGWSDEKTLDLVRDELEWEVEIFMEAEKHGQK